MLSRALKKVTVEAALGAELEEHQGYAKHEAEGSGSGNGHSAKRLKDEHGEVEINVPRDRNGDFEPQLIKKGQTRLTGFDDQILCLYAKGMTAQEIVQNLQTNVRCGCLSDLNIESHQCGTRARHSVTTPAIG